jgi:hypothetical protein
MKLTFHHKCEYCKYPFSLNGEEVYVINNVILETSQGSDNGNLHWRWIREKDVSMYDVTKDDWYIATQDGLTKIEMYFHKDCFQAIAGNRYISKKL